MVERFCNIGRCDMRQMAGKETYYFLLQPGLINRVNRTPRGDGSIHTAVLMVQVIRHTSGDPVIKSIRWLDIHPNLPYLRRI